MWLSVYSHVIIYLFFTWSHMTIYGKLHNPIHVLLVLYMKSHDYIHVDHMAIYTWSCIWSHMIRYRKSHDHVKNNEYDHIFVMWPYEYAKSHDHICSLLLLLPWLLQGQAQECLVEKSLKGVGRVKNITISKLASRVSSFEFVFLG